MNPTDSKLPAVDTPKTPKKPGFMGRMIQKLDQAMKKKAEEKARGEGCCGDDDNQGGKCC